jgi:4-hydroxy-4-methyl-2-oxoglutarate aldolase
MTSAQRDLAGAVGELSASVIADARGKRGVLDPAIRHLHGDGTFGGPAVTARCAPGSGAAMFQALLQAGAGDVLVVQGPAPWAYFGELVGAEAARRGVVAIVVDGFIRDLGKLRELPLAVYARGATPLGVKAGDGEVGVELAIGDQAVAPGDWVIGDLDGIVVVPAAELPAALERAREIEEQEGAVWERVRGGHALLDAEGPYGDALRAFAERPVGG